MGSFASRRHALFGIQMVYVPILMHAKRLNVNFAMENTGRDYVILVTLVTKQIVFFFIPCRAYQVYHGMKAKLLKSSKRRRLRN